MVFVFEFQIDFHSQNFIRTLVEHLYDTVGTRDRGDDEPFLQKYSRPLAIQWV